MEALFILNQMINIILEILEIQPSEDEPLWLMMFRTQLYERGSALAEQNKIISAQFFKILVIFYSLDFFFSSIFLGDEGGRVIQLTTKDLIFIFHR